MQQTRLDAIAVWTTELIASPDRCTLVRHGRTDVLFLPMWVSSLWETEVLSLWDPTACFEKGRKTP